MIPPKYWSPTKKLMVLGAMAGGKLVEDTATGNPLTFTTDKAKPLKSLLIPFSPQQSGTGDPSPENIRSILPWNGLTVFGGGKNLFDKSSVTLNRWISSDGVESTNRGGCVSDYIPVKSGSVFALSFSGLRPYSGSICEYDKSKRFINRQHKGWQDGTGVNEPLIATLDNKTAFIRVQIYATGVYETQTAEMLASEQIQLEVGQTATAYEPYKPITETDIPFASPVYGGTLDVVSGVLMNEWIALVFDGSSDEAWGDNGSNGYYIPAPAGVSAEWIKLQSNYLKGLEPGEGRFLTDWTCRLNLNVTNLLVKPDMTNISSVSAWKAYLAENPLTIVCPLATPQEITLTPQQITALVGDNTIWSDADGSMTAVYLKKG